jgi:hypothetical protein
LAAQHFLDKADKAEAVATDNGPSHFGLGAQPALDQAPDRL